MVTLAELNNHINAIKNYKSMVELEESLEKRAFPNSPDFSGMPHSPGISDKTSGIAIKLVDVRARKAYWKNQVDKMSEIVENVINAAPYEKLRLQLQYRYKEAMSWGEIANIYSEDTVEAIKNRCKRYIKSLKNKKMHKS